MTTTHLTQSEAMQYIDIIFTELPRIIADATVFSGQLWDLKNEVRLNNSKKKIIFMGFNILCNSYIYHELILARKEFQEKYTIIAKVKHIANMFKFIHTNFHIIFDSSKKFRILINMIEDKRIEFISSLQSKLGRSINKYTFVQKEYILCALKKTLHVLKKILIPYLRVPRFH